MELWQTWTTTRAFYRQPDRPPRASLGDRRPLHRSVVGRLPTAIRTRAERLHTGTEDLQPECHRQLFEGATTSSSSG